MRDYVLLYVNGRRHEVRGQQVFMSLSDFLRAELHLTGTKIVCSEGDCGSCTVILGRPKDDSLDYVTVCSCIQYLYQLDGVHVVTVEGLKYNGHLNPVMDSMLKNHGAQCGFCTPGFVVSMCALLEHKRSPTKHDVTRDLVGNLCRCTGYEAILNAALRVDAAKLRSIHELYPSKEIAETLRHAESQNVRVSIDGREFFKPATLADACAYRAQHPDCTMITGGTDLGVVVNKGLRQIASVMSLGGLNELQSIDVIDGTIVAGAACSLSRLEEVCRKSLPEFARLLNYFGSPPIKNAGTIGGNIANGSPIGDTMPAMYVLNGEVELASSSGTRRVNINEFYTGYKKSVMRPDELIKGVLIPLPKTGEIFKLYKVSKRKDLDISSFTAAFWMRVNGSIEETRMVMGGVGPNILRLKETEQFLKGQEMSERVFAQAGQIARKEIKPISDVRGSADYRFQLAENILLKLYFDIAETEGELISK